MLRAPCCAARRVAAGRCVVHARRAPQPRGCAAAADAEPAATHAPAETPAGGGPSPEGPFTIGGHFASIRPNIGFIKDRINATWKFTYTSPNQVFRCPYTVGITHLGPHVAVEWRFQAGLVKCDRQVPQIPDTFRLSGGWEVTFGVRLCKTDLVADLPDGSTANVTVWRVGIPIGWSIGVHMAQGDSAEITRWRHMDWEHCKADWNAVAAKYYFYWKCFGILCFAMNMAFFWNSTGLLLLTIPAQLWLLWVSLAQAFLGAGDDDIKVSKLPEVTDDEVPASQLDTDSAYVDSELSEAVTGGSDNDGETSPQWEVGDKVRMRDNGDSKWYSGVVTEVVNGRPKARLGDKSFFWDQIERRSSLGPGDRGITIVCNIALAAGLALACLNQCAK